MILEAVSKENISGIYRETNLALAEYVSASYAMWLPAVTSGVVS
jgi:hypothetical protein